MAHAERHQHRPLTTVSVLGVAAHIFYELGCGVGMPLASVLGPRLAAATWSGATGALLVSARRPGRARDVGFVLFHGASLSVALGHLSGWPRRHLGLPVPWLSTCEGLGGRLMPAYNVILYTCAASAVAALVRENGSASRSFALPPVLLFRLLARTQHAEYDRMVEDAHRQPRWSYRRLVAPPAM